MTHYFLFQNNSGFIQEKKLKRSCVKTDTIFTMYLKVLYLKIYSLFSKEYYLKYHILKAFYNFKYYKK